MMSQRSKFDVKFEVKFSCGGPGGGGGGGGIAPSVYGPVVKELADEKY